MAHDPAHQRVSYPLMAYNFRVTVDGTPMAFAEVSGLAREHRTLTYRHGMSFREGEQITKYQLDRYVPVTLSRGTTLEAASLYRWLETRQPVPIEISMCDEAGKPVIGWHVARALPVKLDAPAFDASSNEVAIARLEVLASGIAVRELPWT